MVAAASLDSLTRILFKVQPPTVQQGAAASLDRSMVWPLAMCRPTASHKACGASKSGNPWDRLINTGCAPQLVKHFIEDLNPKALDASCLERIQPTPTFIDFNGATP